MLSIKALLTKMLNQIYALKTTTIGTFTKKQSGSTSYVSVRQCGNVVSLNGYISNVTLTANTETLIGTISNVVMPPVVIRSNCNVSYNAYTVGTMAYISINTAGQVNVTTPTANTVVYFNVTYVT